MKEGVREGFIEFWEGKKKKGEKRRHVIWEGFKLMRNKREERVEKRRETYILQ